MTADITNLPPRDPFFALAPELKLHLSETDGALVVNSREVARVFFHRKHRRVLRKIMRDIWHMPMQPDYGDEYRQCEDGTVDITSTGLTSVLSHWGFHNKNKRLREFQHRFVKLITSTALRNTIMTKTTTIKDMHRHVLDLCDKHRITIYAWCARTSQCHALTDRDEIRIVPIESRISYASALHEIGHLRGQHQRSSSTLERERGAWEWARANALIWTPDMENSACKALDWYALHARQIDRPARLKRSAHHEAGHAVIARVLGLLGGAATIAANHMFQSYGGSESYLAATMEHWRRPVSEGGKKKLVLRSPSCAYRAKVMMSMAGREAVLECLGRTNSYSDSVDLDDINEFMPKAYPGASRAEWSRRQDRLRRMTRALVRRHRDKIEHVARALLQHRTLSGRTIDALLPEIPAPATCCVELAAREREAKHDKRRESDDQQHPR